VAANRTSIYNVLSRATMM